ncbi:MAG: hypothetical protein GY777_16880 [Candidatus Brocadiaceae bacterium]|nr:hypothetical protein [Candidatus Brocadiaceae bacterium]
MQDIAQAVGEREHVFGWIDMLSGQGIDVRSFRYANGLNLEIYNGHLSLPVSTDSGITDHSQSRLIGIKKAKWNKLTLNGQNHNLDIKDARLMPGNWGKRLHAVL